MALSACARSSPAPKTSSLDGDVARVGAARIGGPLVAAVSRASGVSVRDAVDRLVEDALLASGARALALDRGAAVAWSSTSALARASIDRVDAAARARGTPTDEELSPIRVIHAVVLRSASVSPARARTVAETIAHAVANARDDADFEARVDKVPRAGLSIRVERLPEFDASGMTDQGAHLDATFAAAALALRSPGDTSPVVETSFGWHVIRLIERRPLDPASIADRRRRLTDAALELRTRAALEARLRELYARTPVRVVAGADKLMAAAFGPPPAEP